MVFKTLENNIWGKRAAINEQLKCYVNWHQRTIKEGWSKKYDNQ